ncbi:zinc finger MYM-type protein 1-like [Prunus persica]|uniref:zinc finger MYM-type protein 1-like n=1 Tax=Prunus persica TaxID=3760 RepID=UPI0009AB7703|nr:zinc finger MYM-type protein 1-like [Prunus persica]
MVENKEVVKHLLVKDFQIVRREKYLKFSSSNQGNFLELLQFLCYHHEQVRAVTLKNSYDNLKLISPKIQKDIVNVASVETTDAIISDMGDSLFSILVDESRDVSVKEQIFVMFRYVHKKRYVIECFIGIEHVANTTSLTLKISIDALFARHHLSISRLCGQGYDGASNMNAEFNGLKTLIMKESPCAFYVHCFAYQLQLALVSLAKNHSLVLSSP